MERIGDLCPGIDGLISFVFIYVQRLKRYGFSLEEIRQIITLSDEKQISSVLRQQRDKLKREQQEKAAILNELQTHISIFERTGEVMTYQKGYQIEIKNSPTMNVLAARAKMSVDEFGRYYGSLFERLPKDHVTPTGLNGARYYDQEFNPESSDIEVFIGIREKEKADIIQEKKSTARAASTIYESRAPRGTSATRTAHGNGGFYHG